MLLQGGESGHGVLQQGQAQGQLPQGKQPLLLLPYIYKYCFLYPISWMLHYRKESFALGDQSLKYLIHFSAKYTSQLFPPKINVSFVYIPN